MSGMHHPSSLLGAANASKTTTGSKSKHISFSLAGEEQQQQQQQLLQQQPMKNDRQRHSVDATRHKSKREAPSINIQHHHQQQYQQQQRLSLQPQFSQSERVSPEIMFQSAVGSGTQGTSGGGAAGFISKQNSQTTTGRGANNQTPLGGGGGVGAGTVTTATMNNSISNSKYINTGIYNQIQQKHALSTKGHQRQSTIQGIAKAMQHPQIMRQKSNSNTHHTNKNNRSQDPANMFNQAERFTLDSQAKGLTDSHPNHPRTIMEQHQQQDSRHNLSVQNKYSSTGVSSYNNSVERLMQLQRIQISQQPINQQERTLSEMGFYKNTFSNNTATNNNNSGKQSSKHKSPSIQKKLTKIVGKQDRRQSPASIYLDGSYNNNSSLHQQSSQMAKLPYNQSNNQLSQSIDTVLNPQSLYVQTTSRYQESPQFGFQQSANSKMIQFLDQSSTTNNNSNNPSSGGQGQATTQAPRFTRKKGGFSQSKTPQITSPNRSVEFTSKSSIINSGLSTSINGSSSQQQAKNPYQLKNLSNNNNMNLQLQQKLHKKTNSTTVTSYQASLSAANNYLDTNIHQFMNSGDNDGSQLKQSQNFSNRQTLNESSFERSPARHIAQGGLTPEMSRYLQRKSTSHNKNNSIGGQQQQHQQQQQQQHSAMINQSLQGGTNFQQMILQQQFQAQQQMLQQQQKKMRKMGSKTPVEMLDYSLNSGLVLDGGTGGGSGMGAHATLVKPPPKDQFTIKSSYHQGNTPNQNNQQQQQQQQQYQQQQQNNQVAINELKRKQQVVAAQGQQENTQQAQAQQRPRSKQQQQVVQMGGSITSPNTQYQQMNLLAQQSQQQQSQVSLKYDNQQQYTKQKNSNNNNNLDQKNNLIGKVSNNQSINGPSIAQQKALKRYQTQVNQSSDFGSVNNLDNINIQDIKIPSKLENPTTTSIKQDLKKASHPAPKSVGISKKVVGRSMNITEEALAIGKVPPEDVAHRISTGQYNYDRFEELSPRSKEMMLISMAIKESFEQEEAPPETTTDFYRAGKMLGRGAFGKVNLGMHKISRKLVAIKSINKEYLSEEKQKSKIMHEVSILLKMRHPSVVKLYETFETGRHILLVMELCAGGDLLNYVRKRRKLSEDIAKYLFKQIVEGLDFIHSKKILHRDIKLDNILLDGKGNVKIADFGVSKLVRRGEIMREQCGTPAYIAPEIIRDKGYQGFQADIWSAGVVLFAMLYGTVPFKANNMQDLHKLILQAKYNLKDEISESAKSLLRALLELNPAKRLTVDQILKHEWMQDVDENLIVFNEQELEVIQREFTYNDPSRFNRNEVMNKDIEPWDCFTEMNLDSMNCTLRNESEKSVILAPFNSSMSDGRELELDEEAEMLTKKFVIKFAARCRDHDRQYEINNNGELDNGVYHKFVYSSHEDNPMNNKEGSRGSKQQDTDNNRLNDGGQRQIDLDQLTSQMKQSTRNDGRFDDEDDENGLRGSLERSFQESQSYRSLRERIRSAKSDVHHNELKSGIRQKIKENKRLQDSEGGEYLDGSSQAVSQGGDDDDTLNSQIVNNREAATISTIHEKNGRHSKMVAPVKMDPDNVQTLVNFGYPQEYVVRSIIENDANYCTTAYYLLAVDQNY